MLSAISSLASILPFLFGIAVELSYYKKCEQLLYWNVFPGAVLDNDTLYKIFVFFVPAICAIYLAMTILVSCWFLQDWSVDSMNYLLFLLFNLVYIILFCYILKSIGDFKVFKFSIKEKDDRHVIRKALCAIIGVIIFLACSIIYIAADKYSAGKIIQLARGNFIATACLVFLVSLIACLNVIMVMYVRDGYYNELHRKDFEIIKYSEGLFVNIFSSGKDENTIIKKAVIEFDENGKKILKIEKERYYKLDSNKVVWREYMHFDMPAQLVSF